MIEISDDCVGCYQCQDECPVDALVMGAIKMEVSEECVGCHSCVLSCPVEAIKEVNE